MGAAQRGTGDGHGNAWNSNYVANPLGSHHRRDDLDHDTYVTDTVRSHPRPGSNSTGAVVIAGALQERDAKGPDSDTKPGHLLPGEAGVRRLTPLECERLMGWPDDHTRYTADGQEIADSHHYRMAGNGVVATVAEWIGRRLVAVDGEL